MELVFVRLIAVLIFLMGIVLLQTWLSKREGKWPGLILPIISILLSLIYPLNMMAPVGGMTAGFILQMLLVWLLANIPTIVLLVIYFACREKQRHKKQLDKMNIQDLE